MAFNFQAKKQIGTFGESSLSLNWDYIIKNRGNRREFNMIGSYTGKFLMTVSVLLLLFILIFKISLGESLFNFETFEPENVKDLLIWICVAGIIYSSYLLRNRDEFLDKVEHSTLQILEEEMKKRKISEIEVTNYFDRDLLDVIDEIIDERPVNYLPRLLGELSEYNSVKALMGRLGVTPNQLLKLDLSKIETPMSDFELFLEKTIGGSFTIAMENGLEYVDERAVFLHLAKHELKQVFLELDMKPEEVDGLLLWISNEEKKRQYLQIWREKSSLKPTSVVNRAYTSGFAGTLNKFSRDYTVEVMKGGFTLSMAREDELGKMTDLLTKGYKSALLLIGEPGVGKTTLLKSLAVKMVVEDVPQNLQDMRLVSFDIAKASAISRNTQSFKKKLQKVFEDTAKAKNIVLVLEDVVQLLSARDEMAAEVVSIIVDALDRYDIRLVITATQETYTKDIKPRTGLMKELSVMTMEEPSDIVSQQILIDIVPTLEAHYKIKISYDAIKRTVELSHKVLHDKVLPQKAIDILEEAGAKAAKSENKKVVEEDINDLISEKVGVKVGRISGEEGKTLVKLEELMHKRVVDQVPAIKAVADALRRSRAGLSGSNRPIASFLFFGPTGVGKTEVAKTIAETYYGNEKHMIRLDMSEFHESENLKRLIGYPEGDQFEGGFLTEPVRESAYSLILLDEIEKAYPKVLDLFLQILDEGYIKDGLGRKVDFTNTIIVATSNASSKELAENLEAGKTYEEVYDLMLPKLRETFKVEFLNRFDKVVMFKPLSREEVVQVAGIFMKGEQKKLEEKGITFTFSDKVLEELGELGYNPVYGGRELRRVVQDRIENPLANKIIEGKLKSGSKIDIQTLADLN